jgi:heptosyltransferase-3
MLAKGKNISEKKIANVLLIQLGDIGDIVWSTPTFRAVNEVYPHANVSVLVREGFGSLLEADPGIHKIFEVKRYGKNLVEKILGQLSLIVNLRKEHFDLAFDLRSDDRGAYMALLSGAKIRAAMLYRHIRWRNYFFTHLADPSPATKRTFGAAEQSLQIVREFGIDTKDTTPRLWVSENIDEKSRRIMEDEGMKIDGRFISVNPFSRWQYKEWPHENWADIINWLQEELGISIAIVGSADERSKSEYIAGLCRGNVYNLTGKTTLSELAGVLRYSFLHVGVDSAAPHIAAAVGTPTITIYGPSDWKEWAPQGKMHRVVTPDLQCSPCHKKGCDGSGISRCLMELKIDRIKKIIEDFLDEI